MIPFFEKTWFLWWILATLVILRWFHLLSSPTYERFLEAGAREEEEASTLHNGFHRGP